MITCPANIIVNNTAGQCGAIVNYPPATATGNPAPVITYSKASGTFFQVGITTVTATATNACGSVACSFNITVLDNEAPVINCPADITATILPGETTAIVNYAVTASDNCPGVTTTLVAGLPSGSPFPVGVTTVTWKATDASGNVSTCSFNVTVLNFQVSDSLSIYPNPNTGHFHIRFYNQVNEEAIVRVFDMRGTQVYLQKVLTTLPYTNIEVELMRDRITAAEMHFVELRLYSGKLIGSKKIIVFK